jgi:hypothetical protein
MGMEPRKCLKPSRLSPHVAFKTQSEDGLID